MPIHKKHTKLTKDIGDRHDEIEAEKAVLDLESSRGKRRSLQKMLLDSGLTQTSLQGSRTAKNYEWAVFAAALFLAFGAAVFSYGGYEVLVSNQFRQNSSDYLFPVVFVRTISAFLVAVGATLWAINWLRKFQESHLESWRQAEKFQRDTMRASWALEAAFEAKIELGDQFTNDWTEKVLADLYQSESGRGHGASSSGALLDLLKYSANVSLGSEGWQATLDKKGSTKAARDLSAKAGK
jgi:hypothetical protein